MNQTLSEQILTILQNSLKGGQLPINLNPDGTERDLIYNPSTDRIETKQSSVSANFITIDNTIFMLEKGYTSLVKNSNNGVLEVNDIVSNGIILNNGSIVRISAAIYTGGATNDFGVFNASLSEFTGGSYNYLSYSQIL